MLWREDASLPAFGAVTALRLARRNHLQVPVNTLSCPLFVSHIPLIAAAGVPDHLLVLAEPKRQVGISHAQHSAAAGTLQPPVGAAKCLGVSCTALRLARRGPGLRLAG